MTAPTDADSPTTGESAHPPMTPRHRAARGYAQQHRLLLIPLEEKEKRPAFKTGPNHQTLATHNVDTIDGWWSHRDYNIGLPCTPNRLAVIDVDGQAGQQHLDELEQQHGPLPATWMQTSDRDDRPSTQFIYRWPNGEMVPTSRISEQLEVRAHGAQIVVAPSIHPTGSTYRWLIPPEDIPELPELPSWVLEELTRPKEQAERPTGPSTPPTGVTLAERRLDGLVAAVASAPEGQRNQTLNHAAYTAARIPGLTDHEITDRLTAAAHTAGLEPRETAATIRSGIEAGHKDGPDPEHIEPGAIQIIVPRKTAEPDAVAEPLKDLKAFLDEPEPEYDWVVDGLLERGDRVILTGTEGSGKSTLLRQMAVSIGAGIHPFTNEHITARRVLYIDLENSSRHTRRQMRPLYAAAGDHLARNMVYPIIRPDGLDLLTTEDQEWLAEQIDDITPDVLTIGPIYKLVGGDPTEEQPAKAAATLLDRLREIYGFTLLMEAHSPHGETGRKRPKRPYGASLWLRWPEFGLHINEQGILSHWRGARDERNWPTMLKRGGEWPWTMAVAPDDLRWQKIVQFSQTEMFRPSIRQLEQGIQESRSSIARILKARKDEWNALFPDEPLD